MPGPDPGKRSHYNAVYSVMGGLLNGFASVHSWGTSCSGVAHSSQLENSCKPPHSDSHFVYSTISQYKLTSVDVIINVVWRLADFITEVADTGRPVRDRMGAEMLTSCIFGCIYIGWFDLSSIIHSFRWQVIRCNRSTFLTTLSLRGAVRHITCSSNAPCEHRAVQL